MYTVVINLKEIGHTDTLNDALKLFLEAMVEGIDNNTIVGWQMINTACWIKGKSILWDFYDARDYAIDNGLFANKKWLGYLYSDFATTGYMPKECILGLIEENAGKNMTEKKIDVELVKTLSVSEKGSTEDPKPMPPKLVLSQEHIHEAIQEWCYNRGYKGVDTINITWAYNTYQAVVELKL